MRWLITLIFAGRNRMVVIRRELPRTIERWSRHTLHRIGVSRILLSVFLSRCLVCFTCKSPCDVLRRASLLVAQLAVDLHPDGPYEAQ